MENKRLDIFVAEKQNCTRSRASKMITGGYVFVNGKKGKNSQIIKEEDNVEIKEYHEEEIKAVPENIPLDIIYEDDDVIVVNKPKHMVVHPAVGNVHGTLVNALLYHFKGLSDLNGSIRPGIVHRIDADTSGLLMVAKNNEAHEFLSKQLEEKKTHRKYIALVHGVITHDTGTIDAPIGRDEHDRKKMAVCEGGKHAVTHFKVLERYSSATLLELKLETGRTHQIRVHLNYIGHPIVNDPVYGRRKIIDDSGQCLHAKELGFIHPKTKAFLTFSVDPPKEFIKIVEIYKNGNL